MSNYGEFMFEHFPFKRLKKEIKSLKNPSLICRSKGVLKTILEKSYR